MDQPNQLPGEPQSSPASGCIILILAVIVLGGSAAFFVIQGFRMNREIDKFTVAEPAARPVADPAPDVRAALRTRLETFRTAALAGDSAELALSADDVNNLIASEPLLGDFRGNTLVVEIDNEFLIAEMSQALNSLTPGAQRYLNATFHLRPKRIDETFTLALVDITSQELDIPREFIELYSQKKFYQLDPENESIGPVLPAIRDIAIRKGRLVITAGPKKKP